MTKEKERITDPGELLDLAKSAARQRMDALGEEKEQIEKIIKVAYDDPWKGGEYLRMRFAMATQDLMISESEYRLATRGSGLYDSTITSALRRFITPGKRISRRMVNGFYHITIVDDLSKEEVTKNHDESIRQGERTRIKGLIAALAVDFAGDALTGLYKTNLFAAIDMGLTASDISKESNHES